jgi:hypothetical protein
MQSNTPFEQAIELIDAANAQDPHHVQADGRDWPVELLYSVRMTERLAAFEPAASDALRLAARAQHICRWQRPRDAYPMDRKGYHQWRTALYAFHADTAAPLLRQAGIDEPTITRVQSLLRKERLKTDAESQTLEDVICLVFLQFYWNDFSNQHDDEKLITILRRTWAKMSPRGHASALELPLDERSLSLVHRALNQ